MHPPESQLAGLAASALPPAEARHVSAHVRECASCRARLKKLAGRSVSRFDDPSVASVEDRVTTAPVAGREKKQVTTQPVLDDPRSGEDEDGDDEALGRGAVVGRYDILRH